MERLAWYKRVNGMNLDHLGEAMGRDPEQLSDWLSGRHHPFKKNRDKIERFLEDRIFKFSIICSIASVMHA